MINKKIKIWLLFFTLVFAFSIFASSAYAGFIVHAPSYVGLSSGLVGCWTFDGSYTKAPDCSGNNNTGTLTNGPTRVAGKIGQGLNFDGSNDEVAISHNSSLNPSVITISFWIYLLAAPANNNMSILEKNTSTGYRIRCKLVSPCTPEFLFNSTTGASGSNLTLNKWTHIVLVGDSAGTFFYTNTVAGTLDTDAYVANATTGNLRIAGGSLGFVNAILDDVRIYNRALSAAEVKRLYNIGLGSKENRTPVESLTQGLVGCWTFDGSYTKAPDCSGNNNTGTLTNGPTRVAGKIGQALKFDGVDDWIDPNNEVIGSSAATVSAWIKPSSLGEGSTGSIVNNGKTIFRMASSNRLAFISDGAIIAVSATNAFTIGPWLHVLATRDATGVANIYLNGVRTGTADQSSGTPATGTTDMAIGNNTATTTAFDGTIDDVRIYNRVLSVAEVKRLYLIGAGSKENHTPVESLTRGLTGYWTLDGSNISGTRAKDSSGNNNHGTLTNGPVQAVGKVGQGLSFDGTDDEVVLDNLTDLDFSQENAFTISAWVRPDGSNASDGVFSRGGTFSSADTVIYYLAVLNTDATRWRGTVSDGTNLISVNSAVGTVSVNQWQYLSLVWDGTTLSLYKDGAFLNSATGTFNGLWNGDDANDRETSIGADGRAERFYWDGTIDDVRIYNRVLSAAEVKRLYLIGAGVTK
ncbi:MAG: LamG domain-containing protein [Candidatus Yanofskybacteria bacterium]|nr:LamG domain-containing protein [Candidatus Yanofskybacteria bacterium]